MGLCDQYLTVRLWDHWDEGAIMDMNGTIGLEDHYGIVTLMGFFFSVTPVWGLRGYGFHICI